MAAHHNIDNLTLVVDRNGLQSDGFTRDVMSMDLEALWRLSLGNAGLRWPRYCRVAGCFQRAASWETEGDHR